MVDRDKKRAARRWWVRTAVAAGGLGAAFVAFSSVHQLASSAPPPVAQTAPATGAAAPTPSTTESDYTTRPVAFIGHDTIITREELGEFLVLRYGADKADLLIDRRIVEIACDEAGVEVTGAEVEASFTEYLKGLGGITQGDFVKQVLHRYGKTLIEWKEDIVRPKLMVTKLCRPRIRVSDDDIREAYEATYGEKIECRIIQWTDQQKAEADYPKIRASEQDFKEKAKFQEVSALASAGGKIKPINRHLATFNSPYKDKESNDRLENEAFRLQPGDVSSLLKVPGGYLAIRCDSRLPADTTINPAAVREQLVKEVTERKILEEIPKVYRELRAKAHPIPCPNSSPGSANTPYVPGSSRGRAIAYIFDNLPVTREELGEFLIKRYGAENLDLLVNKRIIEEACNAKGITVDPADIEIALTEKITGAGVNRDDFVKRILPKNHTSLPQFKEDILRPQLQLTKLSAGRVQVTDSDLKAAYEAYYGEKIECRLIIYPRDERKYAMAEYARLRDSEADFCMKASKQASQELAKHAGHLMDGEKIRLIGKHTMGNTDLERELFSLQPGEVSKLVETPEGIAVMKCDKRYPPDESVPLESVRAKLTKEVLDRKTQQQIPQVFAELRKQADPRLLLNDPNRAVDLTAEVSRDLNKGGRPPAKVPEKAPAGN